MRITQLFDNGQFVVTAEVGPPKGSRRPSGLRKTRETNNSLAHRTTWLRSDFEVK